MIKKYNSYKESGYEWIGEIPNEWNMISIKHLVSTKITDGPHETPTWVDEGIPFLSVESVQDNKLDFNKKRGYISPELHEIYSKKCKPQRDDIFIVKSGSTTGKSTMVETDIEFNIWSPLCIVRTNKNKITPRFMFSSIQSFYFRRFVELGWSFGTQPNIGMGVIENIRIVVPPLSEQHQIVSFLDTKTSLIDSLIEKTQRKIELLKEQRTSLINYVVTKGLNPNVPLKDSGVEWIGEIPEHWEVKKMKYFVKICNGGDYKDFTLEEGGYPVYGSGGVFSRSSKYIYNKTSVLLGRKGSVDKPKIVEEPFWCSDTTYFTKIMDNVNPYYFYYLVQQIQFEFYTYGSTIPSMTKSVYDEMLFPYPNYNEQQEIVEFLDKKTNTIDTTITKEEKRIELLKEYRQSLISEVVTGKIKVCD